MLTQCPSCQTVFRVTPAILRAAHGQVRCGRCSLQFDAVAELLDADEQDIAATQTALKSIQDPTPEHPASDRDGPRHSGGTAVPHEDIVLEGNRIEISGVYPSALLDQDPDFAHTRTIIEEIDLSGEEWQAALPNGATTPGEDHTPHEAEAASRVDHELIDREFLVNEFADRESDAEVDDVEAALYEVDLSQALDSLADTETMRPAQAAAEHTDSADIRNQDTATAAAPTHRSLTDVNPWLKPRTSAAEDTPFDAPATTRPVRWPWALASGLLIGLLCAQLVHHFRQSLARHAAYGATVTRLYAALGHPLAPQWDLNAYRIQQWGMVSDPQQPGVLRMRASVSNGGSIAQPYPLLKISLEDRFGGQVGSRAFTPTEYLGNAAQAKRLLAAGESANIDLALMDPGEAAVGFQFDTCLNSSAGLRCTHSSEP